MLDVRVILFSLLLIVALWFLQGQRSGIRRNGKRLPRPPGTLPLAGNGLWFLQPRYKLLDWFASVQPNIGFDSYEISVPSLPPAIVINDPRNLEHVLKNNELFIKGDFFRLRSWDLFGNGIINADGELWRVQRKAGLRFFNNANLKSFINDVLPPLLADTKEFLDACSESAVQVDLENVLLELTTRLMGKVAYDMDMHSSLPFSKAFDYASGVTTDRFTNPFWRLKGFLFGAHFRKSVQEVQKFGGAVVSAAVEKRQEGLSTSHKSSITSHVDVLQTNLINSLLDNIPDHQLVADSAMNFLSAGRDTTAQSLTWAFYALMRHPDDIGRIRQELQSTFPSAGTSLSVTYDSILPPALPYILATFSETIRLYPPVPIEIKENTAPTILPDGTSLPTGSAVIWIPWAMGRSSLIWGDDATAFNPRRWIATDNQTGEKYGILISKTAFENPVFNAGPRACLGKKMAELLAVAIIANLVWEYDFEEIPDHKWGGQRVSRDSLTLPMEGGLPCRVRRRVL